MPSSFKKGYTLLSHKAPAEILREITNQLYYFSLTHNKDWVMPCDLFKLNFNLNDNLAITSHLQCIQTPPGQHLFSSSRIHEEKHRGTLQYCTERMYLLG